MNRKKQTYTTVRIWESTYKLLKKLAEKRKIPKTQLLRELIEAYDSDSKK